MEGGREGREGWREGGRGGRDGGGREGGREGRGGEEGGLGGEGRGGEGRGGEGRGGEASTIDPLNMVKQLNICTFFLFKITPESSYRTGQKVKCFFGMLGKFTVLSNHIVFTKY